jgi:hypothetical protein
MDGTRASYAISVEIYSGIAMRVGNAALSFREGRIGAVKGIRGKTRRIYAPLTSRTADQ